MNTSSSNLDLNFTRPPRPRSSEDGRVLAGRYRLLDKIGEGGAAEVFRARDEKLDRVVAVKLLRPQYVSDETWRKRFSVEAKAAAGLAHPNIIDIYDFGEVPDGSMFIAMQYVEGQNLKEVLARRGKLPPLEAVAVARQICQALLVAHRSSLIHRDVKPQNIMLDSRDHARLMDFGIVKTTSATALTQTGITFGTAAYLSPEQATGAPVGPTADIYALGCVLYEMLAGTPPFTGDNPAIVAYKQVWEQPRPLHELAPDVSPLLESVVMRCLQKDPTGRYPTAQDLDLALAHAADPSSRPVSLPPAINGVGASRSIRSNAPTQVVQSVAAPSISESGIHVVPPVRVQTALLSTGPQPPSAVSSAQVVSVTHRRSVGWIPLATVLAALLIGLIGLAAGWGRLFPAVGVAGNTPMPSPTVTALLQVPQLSPTLAIQVAPPSTDTPSPVPPTEQPSATPSPSPSPTSMDTPVPTTDTPLPPATDTPLPPPTDTALPLQPTDTPLPPPATDTAIAAPPPPPTEQPEPPTPKPTKTRVPKSTPVPPPTDTPVLPTEVPPPPPPSTDTPLASSASTPVSELERIVDEAIAGNPKVVADYLKGKKTALLTLVQDIWQRAQGKIDINVAREVLLRKLEELRQKPK